MVNIATMLKKLNNVQTKYLDVSKMCKNVHIYGWNFSGRTKPDFDDIYFLSIFWEIMTINSGSRWWNCSVQVYALMLGLGGSDIKALASTILAQWLLCPCPVMVRVVRYLWFYAARDFFIICKQKIMICFVWNAHNRSKNFNCFWP